MKWQRGTDAVEEKTTLMGSYMRARLLIWRGATNGESTGHVVRIASETGVHPQAKATGFGLFGVVWTGMMRYVSG
jgi:hypothetical protein